MLDQRTADILESITDEFFALDHQWRYTYRRFVFSVNTLVT